MINKLYNLYKYLSLARMLAQGVTIVGRSRSTWWELACPSWRPPYPITYNNCRSRRSNSGSSGEKQVRCPLRYLDYAILTIVVVSVWCWSNYVIFSQVGLNFVSKITSDCPSWNFFMYLIKLLSRKSDSTVYLLFRFWDFSVYQSKRNELNLLNYIKKTFTIQFTF